jgi:EAL domain-containing protein (putative c-di-GMP-specific phosphodiesterase class I)
VEITEHTLITDYPAVQAAVLRLQEAGLQIAVDDGGAGYAGLNHIYLLRPDIIKIDIRLAQGIDTDPVRMALARSLVAVAAEIDALVVAEGVETAAESATLADLGIHFGQGFLLARPGPLPAPDMAAPVPDMAPAAAPLSWPLRMLASYHF